MLNINGLHFTFGQKTIFTDLSLSFSSGQITGIIGKNGVGKTTLFRIIAGIYRLQKGEIMWDGKKLHPSDIAFMPTEPYFYPFMKGMEYLDIVANSEKEKKISVDYASVLDLPLDELVDNYSTGMRKKLAFAALFALTKPIIILDEPYNGVDLESNEMIKHIIKTNKIDKIVILSSHILSTITDISQQIYHITDGGHVTFYENNRFNKLEEKLMQVVESRKIG